jgi:hypothetical protein
MGENKNMRSLPLVLAWIIICSCPTGVSAQDSANNGGLLPLLKGYEWELNQELLDSIAASARPDQIQELIEIAQDGNLPVHIKLRAMAVLTRFPEDTVWNFFLQEFQQAEGITRRRIAEAICSGFIESRPDAVVDALGPQLTSNDVHLRILVAKCLQQAESESARKLVSSYKTRVADSALQWEKEALD